MRGQSDSRVSPPQEAKECSASKTGAISCSLSRTTTIKCRGFSSSSEIKTRPVYGGRDYGGSSVLVCPCYKKQAGSNTFYGYGAGCCKARVNAMEQHCVRTGGRKKGADARPDMRRPAFPRLRYLYTPHQSRKEVGARTHKFLLGTTRAFSLRIAL